MKRKRVTKLSMLVLIREKIRNLKLYTKQVIFLIYHKEVLTKHQTTKKIEPVKKIEKNENNKTPKNETLTRSNTKAVLNREQKEKDSKHNIISHTIIKDLNKSAIKDTLNKIPENSNVVINASATVYIAHDILDLIKEYKKIKSKDLNINVKLVGFKEAYKLENSEGYQNTVTIIQKYNVLKRKLENIENKEIIFNK